MAVDLEKLEDDLNNRLNDGEGAFIPKPQDGVIVEDPNKTLPAPVPRLGKDASEKMLSLCHAAATDIKKLGELASRAGMEVQKECEQMAADVISNGEAISRHITGLSQLLAEIGMTNRETAKRLLNGEKKG